MDFSFARENGDLVKQVCFVTKSLIAFRGQFNKTFTSVIHKSSYCFRG